MTDITIGKTIQTQSEKIEIDGYNFDSIDKTTLTLSQSESENVINIYYTKKHDLS